MKKLNKLQINSERLIKNEELTKLRGGYDPCTCFCIPGGYLLSLWRDCGYDCYDAFGGSGYCTN